MFEDREIKMIKELVQDEIDKLMYKILNECDTRYVKLNRLIELKLKIDSLQYKKED